MVLVEGLELGLGEEEEELKMWCREDGNALL